MPKVGVNSGVDTEAFSESESWVHPPFWTDSDVFEKDINLGSSRWREFHQKAVRLNEEKGLGHYSAPSLIC